MDSKIIYKKLESKKKSDYIHVAKKKIFFYLPLL